MPSFMRIFFSCLLVAPESCSCKLLDHLIRHQPALCVRRGPVIRHCDCFIYTMEIRSPNICQLIRRASKRTSASASKAIRTHPNLNYLRQWQENYTQIRINDERRTPKSLLTLRRLGVINSFNIINNNVVRVRECRNCRRQIATAFAAHSKFMIILREHFAKYFTP